MEKQEKVVVTVHAVVKIPAEKAWLVWNGPEHVVNWNFASADWHCPAAKSDLRPGGSFSATMAARDGSMSFDFEGVYDEVVHAKKLSYTMLDGRKATVQFEEIPEGTSITESFEAENMHPVEFQKAGWQAILDNYVSYAESL